jgi:ActR/RegA family two-component response regulator
MSDREAERLHGMRLLIVEDEYLIAADLAVALEERGAMVLGPVGSIADALALIAAEDTLDAAVLDINLGRERAWPIADALRQRGVRFIFATGYDPWIIPEPYREVPRCEKPVDTRVLARLLNER